MPQRTRAEWDAERAEVHKAEVLEVLQALQASVPEIKANIARNGGQTLHLQQLTELLLRAELQQQGGGQVDEISQQLMQPIHAVGDQWSWYFRGRYYAFLQSSQGLRAAALVAHLAANGINTTETTVNNSVQYFKACVAYPALVWVPISGTDVCKLYTLLKTEEVFNDVMSELQEAMKSASNDKAAGSGPGLKRRLSQPPSSSPSSPSSPSSASSAASSAACSSAALATIGDGLEVRTSTIPNAGLGLFANRPFAAQSDITAYQGQSIDHSVAVKRRREGADSHIVKGGPSAFHSPCIDGIPAKDLKIGMGGGSACNHQDQKRCNAELVFRQEADGREVTVVRAKRGVAVGEEIFVNYGRDYWKGRGG
jgi:hypothetical protein